MQSTTEIWALRVVGLSSYEGTHTGNRSWFISKDHQGERSDLKDRNGSRKSERKQRILEPFSISHFYFISPSHFFLFLLMLIKALLFLFSYLFSELLLDQIKLNIIYESPNRKAILAWDSMRWHATESDTMKIYFFRLLLCCFLILSSFYAFSFGFFVCSDFIVWNYRFRFTISLPLSSWSSSSPYSFFSLFRFFVRSLRFLSHFLFFLLYFFIFLWFICCCSCLLCLCNSHANSQSVLFFSFFFCFSSFVFRSRKKAEREQRQSKPFCWFSFSRQFLCLGVLQLPRPRNW